MKEAESLLAVYSDVHADFEALHTAYSQACVLGCDLHLCLGDFVDEARPAEEVVAFLIEKGIKCVRGNHERWLLNALGEDGYRHPLSPEAVAFLKALPSYLDLIIDGVRVAAHHARPGSDMDGLDEEDLSMAGIRGLLAEAGCDVLLVGHTHRPCIATHPGGGLVANPGALGRPPFVSEPVDVPIPREGAWSRESQDWNTRVGGAFGVLHVNEARFEVLTLDPTLARSGHARDGR